MLSTDRNGLGAKAIHDKNIAIYAVWCKAGGGSYRMYWNRRRHTIKAE